MTTAVLHRLSSPSRRRRARAPYGRYALASLGLAAIASGNGAVRELTYARYLDEQTAHALSLVPMAALFGAYVYALESRWPLPTWRSAIAVGGTWASIAASFDLGLGHYVEGASWSELLDPNLVAVVACSAAAPGLIKLLRRRLGVEELRQASSSPSESA